MQMGVPAFVPASAFVLWLLVVVVLPCACSVSSSTGTVNASSLVVGQSTTVQISPGLVVEGFPSSKPGAKVFCERVEIHGLSRLKNLKKFSHTMKVNVSFVNPSIRPPNVEICFHRNASLGIGMCPYGRWEKLKKGSWVRSMSPFDHKLLDVCLVGSSSGSFEVSLHDETFVHRIIFLVFGIVMMAFASSLSNSLTFYYGGAMAVGVILVILMVLFQGMKLLPTGRKSSLAVVLYSSVVGVGSFVLSYLPKLLRSTLIDLGIGEDMYNPVAVFLLAFIVLAGAWLGFWVVRKLVLTEDGSIDIGVSHFVAWSIRVFSSVMILQSSVDPLLALEALLFAVLVSSVSRGITCPKFIIHLYRSLWKIYEDSSRRFHKPDFSPIEDDGEKYQIRRPKSPGFTTPQIRPSIMTRTTRQNVLSDSESYLSTFHKTPERKRVSKEQWDTFTKESTRRALEGLVSSPDFGKWAVAHADRITLLPHRESQKRRRRWWFPWG